MALVTKVNSTYNQINENLRILEEAGMIRDEHHGRARLIRLQNENPRTVALLQALKILESMNRKSTRKDMDHTGFSDARKAQSLLAQDNSAPI
jgi:hypothetical protein